MAFKFDLSSPILREQLEGELKFNFPEKKIKRNLWGNLLLRDSVDVSVVFNLKMEKVSIYAVTPFMVSLFSGGNIYTTGLLQDEKNEAENRYAEWFKGVFAVNISETSRL